MTNNTNGYYGYCHHGMAGDWMGHGAGGHAKNYPHKHQPSIMK